MDFVSKGWDRFFRETREQDYCRKLHAFLDDEYSHYTCYPPRNLVFNAFHNTPYENIKAVIIGQDPYHEPGQAMGMCFSVPKGVEVPPSLVNIKKEIASEFNTKMNDSGDLTYLARQGVLLLNSVLSVRKGQPLSHNIPEYRMFLEAVLNEIDKDDSPIVFFLWGSNAKRLRPFITNPNRLVLEAVHPSPLSANRGGWFGNGHFLKCNEYLMKHGIDPIDWNE